MSVHRRVTRIGGSLAVTIPRDIANLMEVEAGTPVRLSVVGRQMVVEPEDDTVNAPTFRRAFSAVLRRYSPAFAGLARFDRGGK